MEEDRRSEIVGDEGEWWTKVVEKERLSRPTGHAGALS